MATAEARIPEATAPEASGVVVRLLGTFAVTAGERAAGPWPRPTARRLCQLVLISPGRRVSRDLACEELFATLAPQAAARALSKALSMARSALAPLGEPGASLLAADLTHIWAAPGARVDAEEQAIALRRALGLPGGAGRDEALIAALTADEVLLADEPYAEWAAAARERLEALRQEARLALARDRGRGLGHADADAALDAWRDVFEHDPAGEEAAGALLRGYLRDGRRELAARVYERCAAALAALDLHTSPSLDELHAALAQPAGSAPAPVSVLPPVPLLAPVPVPAANPAPREELRTVTMLFAEVGVPAGRLDPEALHDMVGGLLASVIAEVEALGGRVTSVSGRGLQAMFGAPEAHEDDPERAVRAAYRSLSAVSGAAAAFSAPDLRIGVETGAAVVGPIGGGGKVEYGALGEVVAVAADLQSRARPGTALVGPVTRAAVGHLFTWKPAEEGAARLGEPLVSGGQPRTRGPLVGRRAEIAVLDSVLREALRGNGSVALLRGEPGLGKTRLVQECRERFMAWAGARSGRLPLWLEGRAASYSSATPYGLYQQLLAGWLGVALDQPAVVVRAALERALTELLASTELLPLLEHVMGLDHGERAEHAGRSPEELRRAAFGALRTVISRLVPARRPAVIVLEDLHWADPTSLSFTRELVTLAAGRPLLILATTRPEGGPDVDALRRAPGVRTVGLRPLPGSAERELAAALIGSEPGPEVIDAVLVSVDGNPLFLEERLSALLETGTLSRGPGGWTLSEATGPAVPQVLDRLLRSRIDRLSPAGREVVRVAAVLGPEFQVPLLAQVCRAEAPGTDLEAALDELRARGIVSRLPGQRVADAPDKAMYRFRHALIQEAAYNGLLRADRRRLHGRAATAMEAIAGCLDEAAAVVGRHFAAAGEAARALHYLEIAGDHATWAFANDEAVKAYQEAGSVSTELGDADAGARLQAKLANVLWRTGRLDETRAAFTEALRLADLAAAQEGDDKLRKAHLLTRLGRLEMSAVRYDAAAEALDAAAALLGDPAGHDDDEAEQWLEMMIDGRADHCLRRGDTHSALAFLEQARPVLEARGSAIRRHGFYLSLAMQQVEHAGLRASEQAVADMRRSLAAAEESGDTKDIGYATDFLGWMLWLRRDYAEAAARFRAALEIAERVGETVLVANSAGNLAMAALGMHDVQTVRDLAPRAVAAARGFNDGYQAWARAPLAWLAWRDGRPDDVIAIAEQLASGGDWVAGDVRRTTRYRWAYLLPLAAVYLDRRDAGRAVEAARPVLRPGQQALPDELAGAVSAACRAWDDGCPEEAARLLGEALGLAAELGFL